MWHLQTLQVHRSHDVDGTGQLFVLYFNQRVKGQIMYFLVNASSPKSLNVATLNFAGA